MPAPSGGKRKRGDRSYSGDSYSRPSPHRPGDLGLAHNQAQSPSNGRYHTEGRGRGGRRGSRGGRGVSNAVDAVQSPSETAPAAIDSTTPIPEPAPGTTTDTSAMDGATDYPDGSSSIPYSYKHVSDQICGTWDEQGKQQLLEQASQVMKEADELTTSVMMEEIVQSVITGRVSPSSTGDLIKQMVESAHTNMETEDSSEVDVLMALTDAISVAYDNNQTLPIERLSDFLLSANISSEVLRQELDSKLLEKLSLIRQTFDRVGIRKQTNILYRQANFNLMREESEGFAKLVTELFTTSSAEEPSGENVDEALEKVKALIGAFDLDVGRSLDVVLDVFGAVLVKQFRFFVKFLRSSPWWPRTMTETKQRSSTSGLPAWALPGVQQWYLSDDDKATVAEERKARDTKFWSEARTDGLRAFYKLGLATASRWNVDMSGRVRRG